MLYILSCDVPLAPLPPIPPFFYSLFLLFLSPSSFLILSSPSPSFLLHRFLLSPHFLSSPSLSTLHLLPPSPSPPPMPQWPSSTTHPGVLVYGVCAGEGPHTNPSIIHATHATFPQPHLANISPHRSWTRFFFLSFSLV